MRGNLNKMKKALDIHHLTVEMGKHRVIDDVSFTVEKGETVAIIGPNGAGKSVLLKAILRLLPKTSGSVQIFGNSHEDYKRVAPLVSYVPQFTPIETSFPLTVSELFDLKTQIDIKRRDNVLRQVGAFQLLDQRLGTLSGGQRQRVFLAFALADKPQILFLDEPSSGIDVGAEETIYNLIRKISQKEKMTVVLVSHDIDIVVGFAEKVFCLNKRLVCEGHPSKVLTEETLKKAYGPHMGVFHHGNESGDNEPHHE